MTFKPSDQAKRNVTVLAGQSLLSQQSNLAAVAAAAAASSSNMNGPPSAAGSTAGGGGGLVLSAQGSTSEIVVTPTGAAPGMPEGGGPIAHQRKISFVLQDDISAFNASQSMLAVQVS